MNLRDIRDWHLERAAGYLKGIDALERTVQERCRQAAVFHKLAASVCDQARHKTQYWECGRCGGCAAHTTGDSNQLFCDDCGREDLVWDSIWSKDGAAG